MGRIFVLVCLLVPAIAAAQPPPSAMPPPAPQLERGGIMAGAGLWGGNISCKSTSGGCGDSFRKAGGLNLAVGYGFTPRIAALLDFWVMGSSENDVGITYAVTTINVRFWLVPILWVQAGAGAGHAIVNVGPFAARGDDVPCGELAAGLEIVRSRTWMLDVEAKVAQGSTTNDGSGNDDVTTGRAVGVGVGFTWFAGL